MEKQTETTYPDLANLVRGTVLTACINLELIMDIYIAEQFCDSKDDVNELCSLIITPRVPWREKLEIFKVLISKNSENFKIKNTNFYKDILNIIDHRNVFAHFPANISKAGLDEYNESGRMMFHKFKTFTDSKTKEVEHSRIPFYTSQVIDNIISNCNFYILEIKEVLKISANI